MTSQPTSVTVTPTGDDQRHWIRPRDGRVRLLCRAQIQQIGPISTLRFTQAILLQGLALGERLDVLLGFLPTHHRYALPQNVSYTLHEWARHAHALTLTDLVVVETTSGGGGVGASGGTGGRATAPI